MVLCGRQSSIHPQDGPWAWLVCFCCFFVNFTLYGFILSYGVLLPVLMNEFQTSKGVTAAVGSLAMGLSFLFGPINIRLVAYFGEKSVGVFSGFVAATLVLVSSFAQHILVLFFTYGVLLGFFANSIVSALTRSLQKYFKRHLGLASGITTSGASIGILVFTPVLQALVDLLGWRTAVKIMSGIIVLAGVSCFAFDPNVKTVKIKQESDKDEDTKKNNECGINIDCSIWKSANYAIGTIAIFLNFLCLYLPIIHLITFAKDRQIPASKSSLLFIYNGIVSTVVRIVIGKIVDRKWLTPLQFIQLSSYIIGFSFFLFTQAKVYYHFILIMLCYATGNGMFISTQYSFLLTCFEDPRRSYLGFSVCYTLTSFALMSGPPIAGFVADASNSYLPAFYIFGGLIILSGTLPFSLRVISKKETSLELESRLQLIGSRLAGVGSSLSLNL